MWRKTEANMKRKCLIGVVCLALLPVLAALAISICGLLENVFVSDVAVVLGNEVYADGTCSPRLIGRLDRAVSLYREGLCDTIIVSGGVGLSGFDEATGMRDYLLTQGVPETDIVLDSQGVNTRATARFTAAYLRENGLEKAIAVSQFFHMPRSVKAFRKEGVPKVGSAYARYWELRDIFSTLREVPAYFAYAIGVK